MYKQAEVKSTIQFNKKSKEFITEYLKFIYENTKAYIKKFNGLESHQGPKD